MRVGLLRSLPESPDRGALDAACDALVAAEAQGFDDVWLGSPTGAPAAAALAVAAATVAARTSRVGVGLWVTLGDEGHPLHWAESLVQIDIVSAGRARFAGRLAAADAETRARAHDQLAILERAASGAPVTYRGSRVEVLEVQCHPRPVQEPHPPISVVGGADARSLAAELSLSFVEEVGGAVPVSFEETPSGVALELGGSSREGPSTQGPSSEWSKLLERFVGSGLEQCVVAPAGRLSAAEAMEAQECFAADLRRARTAAGPDLD